MSKSQAEEIAEKLAKQEETAVNIARETMVGDLRDLCLDFIKNAPDVWQKLSEEKQAEQIDRVTVGIRHAVIRAVEIVSSNNLPRIVAKVESITIKDGIKAVMQLSKQDPNRHALADSQGLSAIIVVTEAADFLGEGENPQADKDQPALPLADDEDDSPVFDNTSNG